MYKSNVDLLLLYFFIPASSHFSSNNITQDYFKEGKGKYFTMLVTALSQPVCWWAFLPRGKGKVKAQKYPSLLQLSLQDTVYYPNIRFIK